MQKDFTRTLLLDLDGILNQYTGFFNPEVIPKPIEGSHDFLKKISEHFELRLFTTRNKLLASKWLIDHKLDKYFIDITNVKELSWLMVDDRCLKFNGNYDELINDINNFKPCINNKSYIGIITIFI